MVNLTSGLINPSDQYIVWVHLSHSENWVPFGQSEWKDVVKFLKSSLNYGDDLIITKPVEIVEG